MAIILDGTNGAFLPTWTTATRPASPANGEIGYNSTTAQLDQYVGGAWSSVPTGSAAAATPTVLGTVYGNTTPGSGTENCAGGYQALNVATGIKNCAFGTYSGFQITSGTLNTLVGGNSGAGMTTGARNIGVGFQALASLTTKTDNVAIGYQALYNTNEDANTAVGSFSLKTNTTGYYNTAMGYESLTALTTGLQNIAVGFQAGVAVTTGSNNTLLGKDSAINLTTGGQNVMIGRYSGQSLTTGSYNIHIGYGTTVSSASVADEIVISTSGNTGKGANTGFISPNGGGVYQGNNSSSWSTTSDFRLKKNIVDNTEGLDKITQIQVRNFEYKLPEEVTELDSKNAIDIGGVQLGVIAQELQAVLPDCVKEESTGVLTVDSDNLTWYLINAVKELKAELDALKAKVA